MNYTINFSQDELNMITNAVKKYAFDRAIELRNDPRLGHFAEKWGELIDRLEIINDESN